MDHALVVRQKMAERYFLNELEETVRDAFEEHYFDCPECARDMSAGSDFLEHTKVVLAERPELVSVSQPAPSRIKPARAEWFAWLRPAFAAPALALLLAVIGYQNLVMYPNLKAQPQVPAWAMLSIGTWGVTGPIIPVREGKGFLLMVRIPQDKPYASYIADLYNPNGKLEWSLPFPGSADQDQWPMQIPGANREAGTYRLSVRGFTAAGESKDLGSASFELQIQK